MNRLRQQSSRRSGFTLIELILALFMAAILTVSLVSSLKTAYSARAAADRKLEPSRTAEIAFEMLREDFQCAVPPSASALTTTSAYEVSSLGEGTDTLAISTSSTASGTTSGSTSSTTSGNLAGPFVGAPSSSIELSGEIDDIIFFTTADSPQDLDANSEIKQVEYTLDTVRDYVSGEDQLALVRATTRDLLDPDPPDDVPPDRETICRDVEQFACQYYDGEEWVDTWDSTENNNDLPVAVWVTLTLRRPTPNDENNLVTFSRIFTLPCSSETFDSSVNPALGGTVGGGTLGGL